MKESIVIYARQRAALSRLTDAQKGVLFDALLQYAGGVDPTFEDGMVMVAFDFFRAQIDIDSAKYDEVCVKRREAGRKGGQQKQANATKKKQMLPNATKEKQTLANVADNDNENDNVNDNDNEVNNTLTGVKKRARAKKPKEQFEKPTFEELCAYITEKGYIIDPERFYNYYESNGWKVGRNPMRSWKATCANWNADEIKKQQRNGQGTNNDGHPTNEQVIRQTYELIAEAAARPAGYLDTDPFEGIDFSK